MNDLKGYQRAALKQANIKNLGEGEGFAAKIPGFPGLVVFGETKEETLKELESALAGWLQLANQRGEELPSLKTAMAS